MHTTKVNNQDRPLSTLSLLRALVTCRQEPCLWHSLRQMMTKRNQGAAVQPVGAAEVLAEGRGANRVLREKDVVKYVKM